MLTKKECQAVEGKVESAMRKRFGWVIKFTVHPDGSFDWRKVSGNDRYDLYPGMTKQQADDEIMRDIAGMIRQYMPDAVITDYEQSGREHKRIW